MPARKRKHGLLQGARVYLSGPMDFVVSRAVEKQTGWRNRVGEFLQALGVTVFDPWFKPDVRGLHEYGREDAVRQSGNQRSADSLVRESDCRRVALADMAVRAPAD